MPKQLAPDSNRQSPELVYKVRVKPDKPFHPPHYVSESI